MLIKVWHFLSPEYQIFGHVDCVRLIIVLIQGISGKEFNKVGKYKK